MSGVRIVGTTIGVTAKSEEKPRGMRQIGRTAVFPAEDSERTLSDLGQIPCGTGDAITVPAGYELHVSINARPSKALRAARRKAERAFR